MNQSRLHPLGADTFCRMNLEARLLDVMRIHDSEMKTVQELTPNHAGSQWLIVSSPSSPFLEENPYVIVMEISESEEKNDPESGSKKTKNKVVPKGKSYLAEFKVIGWRDNQIVVVGTVSLTTKSNLSEEGVQGIFDAQSRQITILRSSGILSIHSLDEDQQNDEQSPSSKPIDFSLPDLNLVSSLSRSPIELIPCSRCMTSSLFQTYFVLLQRNLSQMRVIGSTGTQLMELLQVEDTVSTTCYAIGTGWVALGYEDGSVVLVDTVTMTNRGIISKHESSVSAICFLQRKGVSRFLISGALDGTIVLTSDANIIDCCHLIQSEIVCLQPLENGLVSVLFSNDVIVLLTVSEEGKLSVLSSKNSSTNEDLLLPPIDRLKLNRQGHFAHNNREKLHSDHRKDVFGADGAIVIGDSNGAYRILPIEALPQTTDFEINGELASPSQRANDVLSHASCYSQAAAVQHKQSSHGQHALKALAALVTQMHVK